MPGGERCHHPPVGAGWSPSRQPTPYDHRHSPLKLLGHILRNLVEWDVARALVHDLEQYVRNRPGMMMMNEDKEGEMKLSSSTEITRVH